MGEFFLILSLAFFERMAQKEMTLPVNGGVQNNTINRY